MHDFKAAVNVHIMQIACIVCPNHLWVNAMDSNSKTNRYNQIRKEMNKIKKKPRK